MLLSFARTLCRDIGDKLGCGGTMTRIPEVLDCWFESGSMSFAFSTPVDAVGGFLNYATPGYGIPVIGMTFKPDSSLARASTARARFHPRPSRARSTPLGSAR